MTTDVHAICNSLEALVSMNGLPPRTIPAVLHEAEAVRIDCGQVCTKLTMGIFEIPRTEI